MLLERMQHYVALKSLLIRHAGCKRWQCIHTPLNTILRLSHMGP